jgi:hypothetical protein
LPERFPNNARFDDEVFEDEFFDRVPDGAALMFPGEAVPAAALNGKRVISMDPGRRNLVSCAWNDEAGVPAFFDYNNKENRGASASLRHLKRITSPEKDVHRRPVVDLRPVVVAFGAAKSNSCFRGQAPGPVEGMKRALRVRGSKGTRRPRALYEPAVQLLLRRAHAPGKKKRGIRLRQRQGDLGAG